MRQLKIELFERALETQMPIDVMIGHVVTLLRVTSIDNRKGSPLRLFDRDYKHVEADILDRASIFNLAYLYQEAELVTMYVGDETVGDVVIVGMGEKVYGHPFIYICG